MIFFELNCYMNASTGKDIVEEIYGSLINPIVNDRKISYRKDGMNRDVLGARIYQFSKNINSLERFQQLNHEYFCYGKKVANDII